jgi:recombination protein RecA
MAPPSDELERFLANARGTAATAKIYSLDELRARRGEESQARWGLSALRGRLVELSARGATATLTAAMELVGEAQEQSEPVAWLTLNTGTFYPPDVADSGIDLAALVVVRCPDATSVARAAERCLRSGAFGLVILDLGGHGETVKDPRADLSMQIQGRLVTLAQTHDAAVVCLTEKSQDTASLGSLVSLRAEALRQRPERPLAAQRASNGEFAVEVRVLKDKRQGPGFTRALARRGPAGLT